MHAPEIVVRDLFLARLTERCHRHANWTGRVEDVADRSVLAGGIDALQDDKEGPPSFGIQKILQLIDRGGVLSDRALALFLALEQPLAKSGLVGQRRRLAERHTERSIEISPVEMYFHDRESWLNVGIPV